MFIVADSLTFDPLSGAMSRPIELETANESVLQAHERMMGQLGELSTSESPHVSRLGRVREVRSPPGHVSRL